MKALYQKSWGMACGSRAGCACKRFSGSVGGLEFDEEQRQAVDKPDQVSPAAVHIAGDPELGGEEEVVVWGLASR